MSHNMTHKPGFYDLRVPGNLPLINLKHVIEKLFQLKYQTIAIDTVIQESAFHVEKGKTKESAGQHCIVPSPLDVNSLTNRCKKKVAIIHRLTVHFSDAEQLSRLSKEQHMSQYALLAVVPSSELAFQVACSHPKVDIISFLVMAPMDRCSRKHYYMAVERGICFEISYAPAISDRELRRNIIYQAHQYHTAGKSRNIVLTGGVLNMNDIRRPYDVVNLGLLFGMSEEQSKAALTYTCRKLLIDAEARRAGRAALLVKRSERWRRDSSSEEEGGPSKRPRKYLM